MKISIFKSKILVLLFCPFLFLSSCDKKDNFWENDDEQPTQMVINAFISLSKNFDKNSFIDNDKISIYSWEGEEQISDNSIMLNENVWNIFQGNKWASEISMKWGKPKATHFILGICPAVDKSFQKTDLTKYYYNGDEQLDLLYTFSRSKAISDSLNLNFKHVLSCADIKIEIEDPTQNYDIEKVCLIGSNEAIINLCKDMPEIIVSENKENLCFTKVDEYQFKRIIVPQPLLNLIVVINNKEYNIELHERVSSSQSVDIELSITPDAELVLNSISVKDWEDAVVDNPILNIQ